MQPKRREAQEEGTWRLSGRIILAEGTIPAERLEACTALLAEEYPFLREVRRLAGEEPRPGDLVLRGGDPEALKGVKTFGEGYVIEAGPAAELTAQSERGVLYGLRRVLEALEEDGLPCGRIVDYPLTGERGLHLDTARKFYTREWIMALLREMSRCRMNVLWFHFSETEGFRIASDRHPEAPSLHHLSKADVKEIIRLAGAYQIDINPALDCPGHLGQALQEHPRWQLPREMAEPLHSALNIALPEARQFLLELIDEYAELFAGSKTFHIGGDEFIDFNHFERFPVLVDYAREHLGPQYGGVDAYVEFLNEVIAHVRSLGFQVRVWNDGLYRPDAGQKVELDREVQIAFWSNWDKGMAPLQAFLDRGYQVVNYHSDYLYYILLKRKDYSDPDPEKILHEWHPGMFPTHPLCGPQILPPEASEQMLGCCYSIWSDWPDLEDEEEVDRRSRDSIRAFGIRCWQ